MSIANTMYIAFFYIMMSFLYYEKYTKDIILITDTAAKIWLIYSNIIIHLSLVLIIIMLYWER